MSADTTASYDKIVRKTIDRMLTAEAPGSKQASNSGTVNFLGSIPESSADEWTAMHNRFKDWK